MSERSSSGFAPCANHPPNRLHERRDTRLPLRRLECPRFRAHLSAWVRRPEREGCGAYAASRTPYPEPFRREAVELVRTSGKSIKEIASDLGVTDQSLRNWVKQHEVDVGTRPGLSSDEREEPKRLRRENRVLREEREILKKAAAFFVKESDQNPVAAFLPVHR